MLVAPPEKVEVFAAGDKSEPLFQEAIKRSAQTSCCPDPTSVFLSHKRRHVGWDLTEIRPCHEASGAFLFINFGFIFWERSSGLLSSAPPPAPVVKARRRLETLFRFQLDVRENKDRRQTSSETTGKNG